MAMAVRVCRHIIGYVWPGNASYIYHDLYRAEVSDIFFLMVSRLERACVQLAKPEMCSSKIVAPSVLDRPGRATSPIHVLFAKYQRFLEPFVVLTITKQQLQRQKELSFHQCSWR